jgi:LPS-assembly lipoprotein
VTFSSAAIRLVLMTLLATVLSGCGFQLRGTGEGPTIPEDWSQLFLAIPNPNGEFANQFRNTLTASGAELVDVENANYRIFVGREQFSQRNLSVNFQARASEFELTLAADFSVQDDLGNEIIPPTTSQVVKQMENDPRNVVGKAEEVRILRSEMRTELVQQIVRRIAYFAAGSA